MMVAGPGVKLFDANGCTSVAYSFRPYDHGIGSGHQTILQFDGEF